ncbi:MAG: hypothetical protein ACRDEA_08570, partial [Microcystaceae cyanobacterium]
MSQKVANTLSLSFPPKIPETPQSLERAIILLGNRTKGELTQKTRQELRELLDVYPDASTAAHWKQSLRQLSQHRDSYEALLKSQSLTSTRRAEAMETELTPETKLMLSWVSQALADYYLDDEGCYDPQLVFRLQGWLDFPEQMPPSAFLSQKFLAVNMALAQAQDPFEFDLAEGDFSVEQQPIVASDNQLSFVEPLVRQALSRVDWCVIGDYLIRQLSLKSRSRRRVKS